MAEIAAADRCSAPNVRAYVAKCSFVGNNPVMLPMLLGLLASTGLRISEAVRLTVDNVRLPAAAQIGAAVSW